MTRLVRCPWCPRHFVAPKPASDAAADRLAVMREAYELLVKHARSVHGRGRVEVQRELTVQARRYAGVQLDMDPFCSSACCRAWHGTPARADSIWSLEPTVTHG